MPDASVLFECEICGEGFWKLKSVVLGKGFAIPIAGELVTVCDECRDRMVKATGAFPSHKLVPITFSHKEVHT